MTIAVGPFLNFAVAPIVFGVVVCGSLLCCVVPICLLFYDETNSCFYILAIPYGGMCSGGSVRGSGGSLESP